MQFTIGQTVIHPHHGPAIVRGFASRILKGRVIDYVDLEVLATSMSVSVPLASLADVGIRKVACSAQIAELTAVLCADSPPAENQWSRRVKGQRIEIATGDPLRIAAVVRDLIRRREERGLSMAEKEMLTECAQPLVAEVALSVDTNEEDALAVLEALVTERSNEALRRRGLLARA